MSRAPLAFAIAAFAVSMLAFVLVTEAPSYMGSAPETCANCHVMDAAYENWYHAPHESWTECVDCHLPHDNVIAYYFEKGRQGTHDVLVFSTGQTPEMIRANEHTQEIVQANCVRCHEETVENVIMGAQGFDRNCWDCHRNTAHGGRGISLAPYQDSAVYDK